MEQQVDEIQETQFNGHQQIYIYILAIVKDGLSRVPGVFIEASELSVDPCGTGNGWLWDLLVC